MKSSYKAAAAAAGLIVALLPAQSHAADADVGSLPAVSGPNGKIEFSGGFGEIDTFDDSAVFRGGAAFSLPLGDLFGLQADIAAVDQFDDTTVGGTLHLFRRDPSTYLLGMAGGAAFSDDANLLYVGPEAEFYMGNVSVELWGGYLNVDEDGSSADDEMFGFADIAFYATDDFRIALGASSIANFESARLSVEWQMGELGMPLSLNADLRAGEDEYVSGSVGFTFYFGGEDKSLIRRHREDDPRIRTLDLFRAAATVPPPPGPVCPPGEIDIDPGPGVICDFPPVP